jgi:hypothetical protein
MSLRCEACLAITRDQVAKGATGRQNARLFVVRWRVTGRQSHCRRLYARVDYFRVADDSNTNDAWFIFSCR